MKKTGIIAALLAAVLILGANIHSALAYFTTYAEAKGGYQIHLGSETEIEENVAEWTKHVTIQNKAGSEPVFIRVKAFAGSTYALIYSDTDGKWNPGADGYYYYADPVAGGASTSALLVKIENIPEEDVESFSVAVVYETTPVLYKEDGTMYCDWNLKLDIGKTVTDGTTTSEGGTEQ